MKAKETAGRTPKRATGAKSAQAGKWEEMVSLAVQMPPQLVRRLEEEAARQAMGIDEYVRRAIAEKIVSQAPPPSTEATNEDRYAGLPRRDPKELIEMARQQGAPLSVRFEDLVGDSWPEDESIDEFIATIRKWRRGE